MSRDARNPDGRARQLVSLGFAINAVFLLAGTAVYFASRSQLVLAQAADSLMDVAAGAILFVSVHVGRQPRDANHPFGHDRAEPIGALVTAVLAGVLAFEVLRSGVASLVTGNTPRLDGWVAAVLAGKLLAKSAYLVVLARAGHLGSALEAARIDARNDVIVCSSSVVGFGLAAWGLTWADAALALPVALGIGVSGVELARDNLRYLMGEAPEPGVVEELRRAALDVPGIAGVGGLRAQHVGPTLQVYIEIVVDGELSLREGHDLGVEVQHALEAHPDVNEAFVHVDTHGSRLAE